MARIIGGKNERTVETAVQMEQATNPRKADGQADRSRKTADGLAFVVRTFPVLL